MSHRSPAEHVRRVIKLRWTGAKVIQQGRHAGTPHLPRVFKRAPHASNEHQVPDSFPANKNARFLCPLGRCRASPNSPSRPRLTPIIAPNDVLLCNPTIPEHSNDAGAFVYLLTKPDTSRGVKILYLPINYGQLRESRGLSSDYPVPELRMRWKLVKSRKRFIGLCSRYIAVKARMLPGKWCEQLNRKLRMHVMDTRVPFTVGHAGIGLFPHPHLFISYCIFSSHKSTELRWWP